MTSEKVIDIVVTARPSWARIKSLASAALREFGHDKVGICLVGPAVSRRYGDITDEVRKLGIEPNKVQSLVDSDNKASIAQSCLNGGIMLSNLWSNNRPKCVAVIADRTETLGVASTAALMQIPLVHIQGGETTGSVDDRVRNANSMLSDLHLVSTEMSRIKLISMGISDKSIHVIGCPSIDLVVNNSDASPSQASDLGGIGADFPLSVPFGIIMFHPDTYDEVGNIHALNQLIELTKISHMNWIWFWPNPDSGSELISKVIRNVDWKSQGNVRVIINLQPEIFISLAKSARILVGNSSFGIREASFIGLPTININSRQINRERGLNVVEWNSRTHETKLADLVETVVNDVQFRQQSTIYGSGIAGERGVEVIRTWLNLLGQH